MGDRAGKCALADLAGAHEEHDPRVGEGIQDAAVSEAREDVRDGMLLWKTCIAALDNLYDYSGLPVIYYRITCSGPSGNPE